MYNKKHRYIGVLERYIGRNALYICRGATMISYNKLWKKLIDLGMKKKDLKDATGIGSTTMSKLNNNEPVSMDVMLKICIALNCNIGDVMDVVL